MTNRATACDPLSAQNQSSCRKIESVTIAAELFGVHQTTSKAAALAPINRRGQSDSGWQNDACNVYFQHLSDYFIAPVGLRIA